MDEGNPVILDALGRIGDIIDEVTGTLQDQLDREIAVHDVTRERSRQVEIHRNRIEHVMHRLRLILGESERGQLSDHDAMAKIRGLLHG